MPRTASFNLTEIKTSPSNPQLKSISAKSFDHVSQNVPKKKEKCCSFSCGWCTGLFIGACCITFFVFLYLYPKVFFPSTLQINFNGPLLVKKGYLRVYPNLPELLIDDDKIPGTYVIDPSAKYVTEKIIPNLDEIFENYTAKTRDYPPHHYTMCWLDFPTNPNSPCYFDPNWLLKDCNKKNHYGFKPMNGLYNPCILLRLEDTENWFPQTFQFRDVSSTWIKQYDPSNFPVGCHPISETNNKKKFKVNMYPNKGFSVHFFPQAFFNSNVYLAPMVMVKIKDLQVGKNFTLNCWIRAKNSWHLKDSGEVTIHFRYSPFKSGMHQQKLPHNQHTKSTKTLSISNENRNDSLEIPRPLL